MGATMLPFMHVYAMTHSAQSTSAAPICIGFVKRMTIHTMCQLAHVMLGAANSIPMQPTFAGRIFHVDKLVTKKEMGWIAA